MTRLNADYQKADPAATIVGKDRVHPGPLGHLVMAYLFLKAQGVPPYVSKTVIDASAGTVVEVQNAKVTGLAVTPTGLRFTSLEQALPFPIPAGAEGALTLVPFTQDLNQEVLSVTNLPAGAYELLIDDGVVGEYADKDLAAGVNLAANVKTPQYQQAMGLPRPAWPPISPRQLRSFALTETYLRGVKDLDLGDFAAVTKTLNERVEKMRAAKSPYAGYYEGQAKVYIADKAKEADYRREIAVALETMRTAGRPLEHRFVLRKRL